MRLINALDILAGRLNHNGIFIIVDIEKFYGYANSADEAMIAEKSSQRLKTSV